MNPPTPSALLRERLLQHRERFSAWYPPHGFSDHGPMASLALLGLGATDAQIVDFHEGYAPRLAALETTDTTITPESWYERCGEEALYPAWLQFFEREFARLGGAKLLSTYLGALASGWVKNAFHPLIRLGYGIEFGLRSEIVAGLAYLASVGPDRALEKLGRQPPGAHSGEQYLRNLQALRVKGVERLSFDERYTTVVDSRALYPAHLGARPLPELCRAGLAVFHATHDFFALHFVTGLHAFRICAPWLGANAASLAAVGLAAGYLAIGAPDFAPLATLGDATPISVASLMHSPDEHDIKLVYSCRCQAQTFGDNTYDAVALRYFADSR